MKLGSCDDLIFEGLQYANNKLKRKEVVKMYAVIYWMGDEVYPSLNDDGQIKLFDKISEADDWADSVENAKLENDEVEARVISIEAAKE